MAYNFDVEQFIHEVRDHREIWDVNSEYYKYKYKRQAAWKEIAKDLVEGFEDMSAKEKEDVYRRLNNRWRNIRDSFVRDSKNRKDGKGTRGYMYMRHLTFLNSIYKLNNEEDWSGNESEQKQSPLKIEVDSWSIEDENSSDSVKRKKLDNQDPIELLETPIIQNATCSYPLEDDDRSFFESLLPAVRNFDIDQKLEFRSEVLCLIKTIRNSGAGNRRATLNR